MERRPQQLLIIFVLLGGFVALAVAWAGSLMLGVAAGLVCFVAGFILAIVRSAPVPGDVADAGRRRFLALSGLGGFAWLVGGAGLGRVARRLSLGDPRPVQEAMARSLGAEYMELVRRAYHPARSGDLQLVLAPFNSSNYPQESLRLVPQDPRTSHAALWMYLERVPLVVYRSNGSPADVDDRVTLADLAPTTAMLAGFDAWPSDRAGRILPGIGPSNAPPTLVVTFVIDGGGWNVLRTWPEAWPNLRRLMRGGVCYTNAIMGSFPAVTASAHATIGTGAFPNRHGITGHNIRDGRKVRKAYGEPGKADPGDILVPTLADLWHDEAGAWVGEIGYQIWHLGMLGRGGTRGADGDAPVAVFWDETTALGPQQRWQPQNPGLYRMPALVPGLDVLAGRQATWEPTPPSPFDPAGRQEVCCSPPIIGYQGDLIEAAIESEPLGEGPTSLLYVNYKAPDYAGHLYNMQHPNEQTALAEVDAQLGRLVEQLERRFGGDYVLIVTADHGQCPLPDDADGVRLDPIQLGEEIEREFGRGLFNVVQNVVPSEVYLHSDVLWDAGATREDVAALLGDYRYRRNIGPYVPSSAIERDLLDRKEFAAVFATTFLDDLHDRDLSSFGETEYPDAELDVPPVI